MADDIDDRDLAILYAPALLKNESPTEYRRLRDSLRKELLPCNLLEHMLVADLAHGEHELVRLQRAKAQIIKIHTVEALRNLLRLGRDYDAYDKLEPLALEWFTDQNVKRRLASCLREVGLDERAIDAEALRLASRDVAPLDKRAAELEVRRDRILRRLEDRRAGLATAVAPSQAPDRPALTLREPKLIDHG
jgi:hypothetical protein